MYYNSTDLISSIKDYMLIEWKALRTTASDVASYAADAQRCEMYSLAAKLDELEKDYKAIRAKVNELRRRFD